MNPGTTASQILVVIAERIVKVCVDLLIHRSIVFADVERPSQFSSLGALESGMDRSPFGHCIIQSCHHACLLGTQKKRYFLRLVFMSIRGFGP